MGRSESAKSRSAAVAGGAARHRRPQLARARPEVHVGGRHRGVRLALCVLRVAAGCGVLRGAAVIAAGLVAVAASSAGHADAKTIKASRTLPWILKCLEYRCSCLAAAAISCLPIWSCGRLSWGLKACAAWIWPSWLDSMAQIAPCVREWQHWAKHLAAIERRDHLELAMSFARDTMTSTVRQAVQSIDSGHKHAHGRAALTCIALQSSCCNIQGARSKHRRSRRPATLHQQSILCKAMELRSYAGRPCR